MRNRLRAASASRAFTDSPVPLVLLDDELAVIAANAAYLETTERHLDDLLGKVLTEAFPDNPDDPSADGVLNLTASLARVLSSGRPHNMIVQRYDVASPRLGGAFVQRVWCPLNSPIIDADGSVVGVRHRVEDVTDAAQAAESPSDWAVPAGLGDSLGALVRGANRAKVSHYSVIGESDRLAGALTAVVFSRWRGQDGAEAARRRQLWAMVMRRGAATTWRGWSHALCMVALEAVAGADACALTLRLASGERRLVAATDHWAETIEDLDHTVAQGPATAAFSLRAPVVVDDLAAESTRWPWFCRATSETGLTGAASFPVQTDAGVLGVLTVYLRDHRALGRDALADAGVLADLAATVLITDLDAVAATEEPSSDYVAVATGLLAAQLGVGLDEALSLLRAHAFATGRPLGAVADDVVHRRIRLG